MPQDLALVADIGGTNARFALADLATLGLSEVREFSCAQFPTLPGAVSAYLEAVAAQPQYAALAVAAPVFGDRIALTNSPWVCVQVDLIAAIGTKRLLLLNDFEALALSLPHLHKHELHQIGGGKSIPQATKVVLGPGTGLGVAGLTWCGQDWRAVPSEGGHILLAIEGAYEFAVLERLQEGRTRVSVERALSGPGLADLYQAVAAIDGGRVSAIEPSEVAARAVAGTDPLAEKAMALFVTWFGRFAGDAALFFGAHGGVYIGGGIAPKILDALGDGRFRQAFEAKGRMASFLAPIPIYVILAEHCALRGAAVALAAEIAAR